MPEQITTTRVSTDNKILFESFFLNKDNHSYLNWRSWDDYNNAMNIQISTTCFYNATNIQISTTCLHSVYLNKNGLHSHKNMYTRCRSIINSISCHSCVLALYCQVYFYKFPKITITSTCTISYATNLPWELLPCPI